MTTSSLKDLKDAAVNSYIDFTPGEVELINSTTTIEEFDKVMHALVAKYNEHPIK